jgi:nifR3 family TIM-barrel protein
MTPSPATTPRVLRFGALTVDPPVVLAPMAGVTNSAFRTLCRGYGAGLYVSEMISARALVEGSEKTAQMVRFGADEDIKSVQLYAVNPRVVAEAVRRVVGEVGVHHIDLNMGCPSPKVTRRGGGAALPAHPKLFGNILAAAVHAAGDVPVTVKMRKGVDDVTLTYLDAGLAAEDAGVAAIALHARTAEQLYSGRADWSAIGKLKSAVATVPVLGNGDVWCADDALAMMRETGCDGVVVGRGCLGKPWLFRDLADAFAGRPQQPPALLGDVVDCMRRHVRLLVELKQDEYLGVRDFRKHVGWYLTGYPAGSERRRLMALTSTLAELDALLDELDRGTPLPADAAHMPRGHLQGPRPVTLPDRWLDRCDDDTPPDGADEWTSGG